MKCSDNANGAETRGDRPDAASAAQRNEWRRMIGAVAVCTLVLFAVVCAGSVFWFGQGEAAVSRLADANGDLVFGRAQRLAKAKFTHEAIETYWAGMALPMERPENRKYRAQELTALCVESGQWEQAIEAAYIEYTESGWLTGLRQVLGATLRDEEHHRMVQLVGQWKELARGSDEVEARAVAMLYAARSYVTRNECMRGIDLVLEVFGMHRSLETASVGLRLMKGCGDLGQAQPLVDYLLAHGDDALQDQARQVARARAQRD